jgi:hypothetical protein
VLRVVHPPTYLPERRYIYSTILSDFLGLGYRAEIEERPDVQITLDADESGRKLTIDDTLFATPEVGWLTAASLPPEPVRQLELSPELSPARRLPGRTPLLYGASAAQGEATVTDDEIRLGADLFGSAFFMLSRYEEIARPVADRFQRFPATASLAFRAGFLDRPIVNEYVELLWSCLSRLWPRLERRQRSPRVLLSHDVDWPIVTRGRTFAQVARSVAGDLVRRHDPDLGVRRLRSWTAVRAGCWDHDVGNTFDFMMTTSERHGLRSAFYFIAGHTAGAIDGVYALEDPWIRSLLRRVAERGHEIGLHPSYNTYRDRVATAAEFTHLRRVCNQLGIEQSGWGGRQHYLRWRNPDTWQNWAAAGLSYDSTLGFADEVGFRCGVCYEYPVYNLVTRQRLSLLERPLIVMDATLLGDADRPNGTMSEADAVRHIVGFKHRCTLFEGDFTLLWHNTWLLQRRQRAAYRICLEELAA